PDFAHREATAAKLSGSPQTLSQVMAIVTTARIGQCRDWPVHGREIGVARAQPIQETGRAPFAAPTGTAIRRVLTLGFERQPPDFFQLHGPHNSWRLSQVVRPPCFHETTWSPWSSSNPLRPGPTNRRLHIGQKKPSSMPPARR